MKLGRILVLDRDDLHRRSLTDYLTFEGYSVLGTRSAQQAHEAVKSEAFELVIADLRLENGSGLEVLKSVRQNFPHTQAILMTDQPTIDSAVECIRLGLFDYLVKPIPPEQLGITLRRLQSHQNENSTTPTRQQESVNNSVVWGKRGAMQEILAIVKKVAQTEATVLIEGESGTGKEVVAQAIVQFSSRSKLPFVKVNCAAVPENLLESEFFGHEKGAFTGATQRREGRFETAEGGTILLDEIAEIPLSLQVKLLRVLQEREFERVGGNKIIRADVRIIASTNRNLQEEVAQGRFREDLFYRLNVVPIQLPPLRMRGADLEELIEHFVAEFARKHGKPARGIASKSMERLKVYRWPGNVRELQNVIERAVIMSAGEPLLEVSESVLNFKTTGGASIPGINPTEQLPTMDEMERRLIACSLIQTNNNKTRTAKNLGISLRTLRHKLKEFRDAGLDTDSPETWL